MKETNFPLGKMLALTFKAMRERLTNNFEKAHVEISAEQFIMLKMIATHENINQQRCADMLRIEKSLFHRKFDAIQSMKLVARIPDDNDRRKNHLVLTEKGGRLLKECEKIEKQSIREFTQGINPKDFEVFTQVLESIRENAESFKNS